MNTKFIYTLLLITLSANIGSCIEPPSQGRFVHTSRKESRPKNGISSLSSSEKQAMIEWEKILVEMKISTKIISKRKNLILFSKANSPLWSNQHIAYLCLKDISEQAASEVNWWRENPLTRETEFKLIRSKLEAGHKLIVSLIPKPTNAEVKKERRSYIINSSKYWVNLRQASDIISNIELFEPYLDSQINLFNDKHSSEYKEARKLFLYRPNADKGVVLVFFTIEGIGGGNNHSTYLAVFGANFSNNALEKDFPMLDCQKIGDRLSRSIDFDNITVGIENNTTIIRLTALTYLPDDPACCPSIKTPTFFEIPENKMNKIKEVFNE